MTIHDIKTLSAKTSPHFFDRGTLKFFGQTMSIFKLKKQSDGRTKISAPMRDHNGAWQGETIRFFNPINNELETN